MLAPLLLAAALLQSVTVKVGGDKMSDSIRKVVRDAQIVDSMERRGRRGPPVRVALTPELLRTAFRDPGARELLLRAREARLRQDSALLAYDATAYQRLSVGFGFRKVGRDRLLFRTENASRVRWSRSGGVWVDLQGERSAFPMVKGIDDGDPDLHAEGMSPIPYFPGRDALWIGANNGIAKAEVDERELVHPIAEGAEAYYTYATGDSISIQLPDRKTIRLRELRIEPRRPDWKLSVGSFWFDVSSGQLVRAAYRFSAEMDIWSVAREESKREGEKDPDDDVPVWVKPMILPMRANLEAVTIDYGLFGNRFWLPRAQAAQGFARVSFMRVPFKIEERFKYASVNGTDSMPAVPTVAMKSWSELRDSLFGDTTRMRDLPPEVRRERRQRLAEVDSMRRAEAVARRADECRTSGTFTRTESRYDGSVRVAMRVPCDSTVLARSSELPPSIYDPGEELFGQADMDELRSTLSGFALQAAWSPRPPQLEYGLDYTRYNRIEGLSSGAALSSVLGKGYTARLEGRIGLADFSPNAELSLARSNGTRQLQLTGYRRLGVANDWGAPLSFGTSLSAFLFGRDEGFYYRSWGAELAGTNVRGGGLSWRLFAERETNAAVETRWSLAKAVNDALFIDNILARPVTLGGAAVHHAGSWGLDPQGWRVLSDLRLEAAATKYSRTADYPSTDGSGYARGAMDVTVSHGLGDRLTGALTAGGGAIGGTAPTQRLFYLGGTQTVRGQWANPVEPGHVGDSYWLARAELGTSFAAARPVIFGDLGWAGPRADFSHPGRPLSGAGVGVSFLDGLVRLDVARGIHPDRSTRLDLYLEARF